MKSPCWSCLDVSQQPVILDGLEFPICIGCWQNLSVEARLKFALAIMDREHGGVIQALRRLAEVVTDRLEAPGTFDFPRGDN